MKAIRLYRHPDCRKCARIARIHQKCDWLGRLEISTVAPKTGPLKMGEIVIENLSTGDILHGSDAFALLCRQIPLYAPFKLLLVVPFVRRHVDREMSGCAETA